jgi:hypothetical protein
MTDCVRERFTIVDQFLSADESLAMRAVIDAHFANPAGHVPQIHQVWNYWYVPGSYTYLRTMPEKVIERPKVEAFVTALRNWTATNLGLAGVTWPFLSMYVPGCLQGLHNDSTNGRLGYVFSLTRDDRRTIGGETVIVHDRDLFRASLDRAAAGTDLFDLVEPKFNRLTLFDDRVPHAVQRIEGAMDPVEGRFVLHGHISETGPVTNGPIAPAEIQAQVDGLLAEIRDAVSPSVKGCFVVRIEIAPGGDVARAQPIFDRLVCAEGENLDLLRDAIVERIGGARFASGQASTSANIPLIF